jgi:hypothetical protein
LLICGATEEEEEEGDLGRKSKRLLLQLNVSQFSGLRPSTTLTADVARVLCNEPEILYYMCKNVFIHTVLLVKSLCLSKYYGMNTYRGVEVYLHVFFTLAPDRGEWSASRPGRFTPGKELPVPISNEARRALQPVWKRLRKTLPRLLLFYLYQNKISKIIMKSSQ